MNSFIEKHPGMFRMLKGILVLVLLIMAANAFGFFKRDAVSVKIEDDVFTVSYGEEPLIRFGKEEVLSAEYLDGLDPGSAVRDLSEGNYLAGEWKNEAWGNYTLCVRQGVETFILLRTEDAVYVFNYVDEDTTEGICNALAAW